MLLTTKIYEIPKIYFRLVHPSFQYNITYKLAFSNYLFIKKRHNKLHCNKTNCNILLCDDVKILT